VKKLLNLKQWLSVADAARHLSLLFGEDVTEVDVLRLALDGHLTLSVHLVNKRECLCGPLVQIQDAKRDTRALDKNGQHPIVGVSIDDDRVIECGDEIEYINGVWDLSMIGSERAEIESRSQALTNGPTVVGDWWLSPILVSRENGIYCRLVTRAERDSIEPFRSRVNYYGSHGFPADAVLVVRTSALHDLEARMSEPAQIAEKPLGRRERNTLLVIIGALAELPKIDVKKPSGAAVAIEAQTALMGARVAARTIEDHLKRIPDAIEDRNK
jgi:hypothetical protein